MSGTAERYLKRLEADPQARLALLACSAALQIDDDTAGEAVELVAKTNGATRALVTRVKKLGCVWKEWNGYWHVAEDVRRDLVTQLHRELPETIIIKLRALLARRADSRSTHVEPADQVSAHEKLFASLEAAYHRLMVPATAEEGANSLVDLWRRLPQEPRAALARSVDHLAEEVTEVTGVSDLPDAIVFLRGVAARGRGDTHTQEAYFVKLFRDARHRSEPGFVPAKSAHFLGLLVQHRNPKGAEKALRTAFRWMDADRERGLIWIDLARLIAKDTDRQDEALQVYQESLELLPAKDQVEVHLAMAALLRQGGASQLLAQMTAKQVSAVHEIPVPESLFDDDEMSSDQLRERVEIDMFHFCVSYLSHRVPANSSETRALVDDLYTRFFKPRTTWKDEADFFACVAQILRRILLDRARKYPTLNVEITKSNTSQVKALGKRPKHDFLDLDEAVTRLKKLDPAQGRLVELIFYAGLSPARVAEVMRISEATVSREWRFARAFLKREVRRATAVRKGINLPSVLLPREGLSSELR
ncbi:MAG TPA: ECF-type sigma factor [Pyrinomonadaceae bacterium]|nr:ECF-type sigma factor [Pyrinomonadaceae bacterium]